MEYFNGIQAMGDVSRIPVAKENDTFWLLGGDKPAGKFDAIGSFKRYVFEWKSYYSRCFINPAFGEIDKPGLKDHHEDYQYDIDDDGNTNKGPDEGPYVRSHYAHNISFPAEKNKKFVLPGKTYHT